MESHPVEIGRICRLQIQTSSLKQGSGRDTYYDPSAIVAVDAITVTRDGAVALIDGTERIDVHNNLHPDSKQRNGINPLSIGFTAHYAKMRARFGGHLVNGIAGENLLVETDGGFDLADVSDGFQIERASAPSIMFAAVSVAHPCVEFSRFALDDPAADPRIVSEVLRFLDGGVRGFYASVESSEPVTIQVGDRVLRFGARR